MNLQDFKSIATQQVKIEMTASDLQKVIEDVVAQTIARMSVLSAPQMVSMKEAVSMYGKDRRTITKYIKDGIYRGEKQGGEWMVETPASRAQRLSL